MKRLLLSRLLGFVGVSIIGLLAHVAAFRIFGGGVVAVGITIEWIPKVFAYLFGGFVVSAVGAKRTYFALEALRVTAAFGIALLTEALIANGSFGTYLAIAACAALYQVANAISNIVCEASVAALRPPEKRALGHTLLIRMDLLAGVVCLPLVAALAQSSTVMFMVAAAAHLVNALYLLGYCGSVLDKVSVSERKISSLVSDFRLGVRHVVETPELVKLLFLGLLSSSSAAMLWNGAPLLLPISLGGQTERTMVVARAAVTVGAFLWTFVVSRQLTKPAFSWHLWLTGSLILLSLMVTGLFFLKGVEGFFAATATFSLLALLGAGGDTVFRAWQRERRQDLIPESARLGLTGILIVTESLGYLVSASLIGILGRSLALAFPAVLALALVIPAVMGAFARRGLAGARE